ncbi:MAG: hypothetical protein CVU89_04425 [Firmicutes bacterium HGW-Firmicutes-14]|nr:MAG: hypothetical protein CVU89_04425 [Firmicutes bacterium HGW-Firmicutes-14]
MIYFIYPLLLAFFLFVLYMVPENFISGILANPVITFGFVITGAFLSAALSKRNRIIIPNYPFTAVQGLLGGILMGYGSGMALLPQMGNTLSMIHGVFYWLSRLMPQGFIYLAGMLAGGYAALALQKRCFSKVRLKPLSPATMGLAASIAKVLFILLLFSLVFISYQLFMSSGIENGLLGTGLALMSGFLLERNRMCMGLMMKETFYTGSRGTLVKAAAITVLLGISWQIPWRIPGVEQFSLNLPTPNSAVLTTFFVTFCGSLLMGFGYIMSDGCFMGSLWKAGQGILTSLISVFGIFIGAAISIILPDLESAFPGWQDIILKTGLLVLLLIWTGAYLMEPPNKTVKRGSLFKWLFSEATILLTLFVIFAGPKSSFPLTLQGLGAFLYLSGIILYVLSRIYLGKNWGEAIVIREGHKIVTEGPYRIFNHPIYISMVIMLVGISFLNNSLWGTVGSVGFVMPFLVLRAREEQRILKEVPEENDLSS